MSKLNDHIEEYLNYYLDLKTVPDFAVLLSGEWGCGKTWFIKKFIGDHQKHSDKPLRFLYITLYGLTNAVEIEDQIFQQLHPVLSSKPMLLAGKVTEGDFKDEFEDRLGWYCRNKRYGDARP